MNITAILATQLSVLGISPNLVFLGNTVTGYILALGLFIVLIALFKLTQFLFLRHLARIAERTKTDIDDTLIRIVGSVKPQFYGFLALYLAARSLSLSVLLDRVLIATLLVLAVYQVVKAVGILIDYIGEKKLRYEAEKNGTADLSSKAAIELIKNISKGTLWVIGLLLVLSNLGVEVTSLIAGLGIGGIAIAFALQAILGDLFSSFTIYFDKPFRVGDFIVVDDLAGVVEKVGIKTTRLRMLQGEEVVISNSDLTASRIHNYKRMKKRRIVFPFGVVYETPATQIKKIPSIVEKVFASVANAELDRVHFKSLGDFSLNFETVYYVLSDDYGEYMNIQQNVNIALMEIFEKEGIIFAYPTQTIHVTK